MGILMLWPLLIFTLCLYIDWRARRSIRQRNERITRAYIEAVERSIKFQREQFEASR